MSSRKPRSVANPLESAITTPSERILKECHGLYVDNEHGKSAVASIRAAITAEQRQKSSKDHAKVSVHLTWVFGQKFDVNVNEK